ncbi:LCAT acyltransferase, partial [Chloropsis hardwickii]|nr:LCAT acyltransferase [Chloropsis hardwickii]
MGSGGAGVAWLTLSLLLQPTSQFWLFNVLFPPTTTPEAPPTNSTPPVVLEGQWDGACDWLCSPSVVPPVPGCLGNQLEAKLDKPDVVNWMCYRKTEDYFTIWLNLNTFLPVGVDCWIDNTRVVYNRTSRKMSNAPGVHIRVPGFGKTYSVEYLDQSKLAGERRRGQGVWGSHVLLQMGRCPHVSSRDQLCREPRAVGLRDISLGDTPQLGASREHPIPDPRTRWDAQSHYVRLEPPSRRAYQEQSDQDQNGKSLTREGHRPNSHSLACPAGDEQGIPLMSNIKLREEQRMTTTSPWMFPTSLAWPESHVFISTPSYNYTYRDYQRFFTDVNLEDGWYMWEDMKDLLKDLPPPGVDTYCLYGTGFPTAETYVYDERFPYEDPVDIIYGDGDDSVNTRSLELCKRWRDQQKQKVYVQELRGAHHFNMIFSNLTLSYINEILLGSKEEQGEPGQAGSSPEAGKLGKILREHRVRKEPKKN